jgi:hypothetical protein
VQNQLINTKSSFTQNPSESSYTQVVKNFEQMKQKENECAVCLRFKFQWITLNCISFTMDLFLHKQNLSFHHRNHTYAEGME